MFSSKNLQLFILHLSIWSIVIFLHMYIQLLQLHHFKCLIGYLHATGFKLNYGWFVSIDSYQIRSDQSLSHVRLFVTPWIAARQASLSITSSRSSLRLTSIERLFIIKIWNRKHYNLLKINLSFYISYRIMSQLKFSKYSPLRTDGNYLFYTNMFLV